jgi:hypothetical protein
MTSREAFPVRVMEDYVDMFWPVSIPFVAITGVFVYAIIQALARARVRELEVRERIAMIERGLVPPPEKDPGGFDRAMSVYGRYRDLDDDRDFQGRRRTPARYRSAGVTLLGIGFGLMLLISVTGGAADAGIGVGGFLVIIGLAFLVNSWLTRYDPPARPAGPPPPPRPPDSGNTSPS